MEQSCVDVGELYRSQNFGLGLITFVLVLLLPFAVFVSLLIKRKLGFTTRTIKKGLSSFYILVAFALTRLFLPMVSEASEDFVRYYSTVFGLALFVLYVFLVLIWLIGAFKTRWKPRKFELVPAAILLAIVICAVFQVLEANRYYELLQLPRCEQSSNLLPSLQTSD